MFIGRRLGAIGLLWLGVLVFFWPMIAPNQADRKYFGPGDFWLQFVPFHTFAARQLAAGRLALWDPYMFSGHPFQADIQTAVLYPIAAANEWLGGRGFGYVALEWEAIVHFGLAATFTFLLIELLAGSVTAGLLGAVVFTFGGFLTSYPSQQLPVLESTTWLPLELYCLERAARGLDLCHAERSEESALRLRMPHYVRHDKGRFSAVVLGLCHSERSEESVGLRHDKRRLSASSLWLALAGASIGLSILAGHPQTVLYLAYLGAAYFLFRLPWRSWWRGIWAVLPAAGLAAVQLLPSLQLFALNHKGRLDFGFAAGGLELGDLAALLFDQPSGGRILYIGLASLALALLSIVAVRSRQTAFWGITGAVALVLSLGTHGPLFRLFFDYLPGWDLFRDQERAVVWFALAAAILAGYGLAWLGKRLAPGMALALAVVLLGVSYGNLWWANANNNISATPPHEDAVASLLEPVMADSDVFRVRLSEEALGHNTGNLLGLQFVSGDSPFELQRFKDWTEDEPAGRRVTEWQLLRLTNSHYVISSRELCAAPCGESDGLRLLGSVDVPAAARILESQRGAAAPARRLYLYRVLFPLPRAFFLTQAQPVAGERQAIDTLNRPDFDPAATLLLQGSSVSHSSPPAAAGRLRAEVTGYAPGFVEVRTSTDQPAYLYLSEVSYPDWQATIDGQPAPVLTADGLFSALDVPPGDHHVVLQYVPKPFYLGAAISGATILALAVMYVASIRRKRAKGEPLNPLLPQRERLDTPRP